jgi:distribution and morphology protein 31
MSGITKRRLWSQLWDARSPSISNGTRIHTSTSTHDLYSRPTGKKFVQGTRQPSVKPSGAAKSKSIFSRYAKHGGFMSSGDLLFEPSPKLTATSSAIAGRQPSYIARAFWTARSLNLRREFPLIKSPFQRAIHFSIRGTKRPLLITQNDCTSGSSNRVMRPKSTNQSPESQTLDKLRHNGPQAKDVQDTANYFHLPHLPKMPHRPSKEELLAAATGFWSRLKVRFKWFSIRSVRPWNVDDWSAFVSWLVVGHIVWVLVGTTTFFSILILTINTVVAQGEFSRTLNLKI